MAATGRRVVLAHTGLGAEHLLELYGELTGIADPLRDRCRRRSAGPERNRDLQPGPVLRCDPAGVGSIAIDAHSGRIELRHPRSTQPSERYSIQAAERFILGLPLDDHEVGFPQDVEMLHDGLPRELETSAQIG
jgi:hypothetical protein